VLVDTHCHLTSSCYSEDREEVVSRIRERNFFCVIESTLNLSSTKEALNKFLDIEFIYFSLGYHPYYAQSFRKEVIKEYASLKEKEKRIIGIGEVGLDYKSRASLDFQEKVFREFVYLAKDLDLVLVIHNRGFKDRILKVLDEAKIKKVVFHCFSQDKDFLKEILKRDYFISYAGNLTFKNAHLIKEAFKNTPYDKLLVETDSPYLAVDSIRGRRNEPIYVEEIIEEMSRLRCIDKEEIKIIILKNTKYIFNI